MVIFGDIGLQMPSYEELQGATVLANTFVERLKKQPELMPSDLHEQFQSFLKDQPKVFNPKYEFAIDFISKSEVYFRYKEMMAKKGITLYHAPLEEIWSSDLVKLDRAYSFLNYIKEHPALLPEDMTADNLDKAKLTKEKADRLASYWGQIYSSSLAGVIVDSPNQLLDPSDSQVTWGELINALLADI